VVVARRGRLQIWLDILSAVQTERVHSGGRVRPTRIQSAANVPHDRFWAYATELQARGLLQCDPLHVTPEGDLFLQEAHRFQEFFLRFGIGDPFSTPSLDEGLDDRRLSSRIQRPPPALPTRFHS